MFALAWIFLADQPAYRTGVIIVGLARCIAMVLVWNDIALGDRERAAVLVVFNAALPGRRVRAARLLLPHRLARLARVRHAGLRGRDLGGRPNRADLPRDPARSPATSHEGSESDAAAATGTRSEFIPRISPLTLYGLLFTIVLLFAIQGEEITSQPLDVALIAVPLLVYFAVMWFAGFAAGQPHGLPLSADGGALVHGCLERLRARDRRRGRRLRGHVRAKLSPAWSGRSSRCRFSSRSSTSRSGCVAASPGPCASRQHRARPRFSRLTHRADVRRRTSAAVRPRTRSPGSARRPPIRSSAPGFRL